MIVIQKNFILLNDKCCLSSYHNSTETSTLLQEERRAVMPRYQPRPAMAVAAVPVSVAAIAPPVSSVTIMSPMAGPPIMRHAMHLGPPAAMLGGNMNMMRPPPMGLPPGKSTSDMVCHVMLQGVTGTGWFLGNHILHKTWEVVCMTEVPIRHACFQDVHEIHRVDYSGSPVNIWQIRRNGLTGAKTVGDWCRRTACFKFYAFLSSSDLLFISLIPVITRRQCTV